MSEPRILTLPGTTLIGMNMRTSHSQNNAPALWKQFMPRRDEITHGVGNELYSVQCYDEAVDINKLNLETPFTRWVGRKVNSTAHIPPEMSTLELDGLYAVFPFKGTPAAIRPFLEYIHKEWLPSSGYFIDHRPHFEILGEKYKRDSPDSEEDIYVPVRKVD